MINCPMIVIFFIRLIMYPYKEILFEILGDKKKDVINFFQKIYINHVNMKFSLNSMFPPSRPNIQFLVIPYIIIDYWAAEINLVN